MRNLNFLVVALMLVGFIFAGCSDSPDKTYMKYNLVDETGAPLGELKVYGSSWSDVDDALSLQGLARMAPMAPTDEHPWGGEFRMAETEEHPWGGEYKAADNPCKAYKCGDYSQADPAGDSCASSNSSCYCFPCPIVVTASAKKFYKFTLDGAGSETVQVYGAGSPTKLLDDALSLRGLTRSLGDDHTWGGEFKAAEDPCKPKKCGDYSQADPAGDSCASSNSSCYCFPCPIVVNGAIR